MDLPARCHQGVVNGEGSPPYSWCIRSSEQQQMDSTLETHFVPWNPTHCLPPLVVQKYTGRDPDLADPRWLMVYPCPQILEEKHTLAFHLQQQQLIELIRGGKVDEALEFAQEYLAPLAEEHPALLEELGASPQGLSQDDAGGFSVPSQVPQDTFGYRVASRWVCSLCVVHGEQAIAAPTRSNSIN